MHKLLLILLIFSASKTFGEVLRAAVPNPIGQLDPATSQTLQDRFMLPLVFDSLVFADSNDEVQNLLIKRWDYSETEHKLRLSLGDGHFFSDGSPLQAKDIYNSLLRLCSGGHVDLIGIEGCSGKSDRPRISVKDKNTIDIYTTVHPLTLLYQLANGRGAIAKQLKSGELVGSGPYIIKASAPNKLILEKNRKYWKNEGEHSYEKIEFEFVPVVSLKDALGHSKFHEALMYLSSEIMQKDFPNYSLVSHSRFVTQTLVLNPKVQAFKSIKLRQALAKSIYETDEIMRCHEGIRKAYGFIPEGIGGSIESTAPDSEKRKNDESQVPSSNSLDVTTQVKVYRHLLRKNDCEELALKKIFRKFNIELEFEYSTDYPKLFKLYGDEKTSGYIELMAFISRDPMTLLSRFAIGTKQPMFFNSNSEYKTMLQEAWSKPTVTERFSIYRKISQKIRDFSNVIPLYYVAHTRLIHRCLGEPKENLITFNPNSFLFLKQLSQTELCKKEIIK